MVGLLPNILEQHNFIKFQGLKLDITVLFDGICNNKSCAI